MRINPHSSIYHICVAGHLDDHWQSWFENLTVTTLPSGETLISGLIIDQAAVHGILNRIRDLGLELIYLHRGSDQDADRV
jgi:hypothetical protein